MKPVEQLLQTLAEAKEESGVFVARVIDDGTSLGFNNFGGRFLTASSRILRGFSGIVGVGVAVDEVEE